jgi:hypothetical protein
VAAVAAEFRQHGIAATELIGLMKAADLTHGGFTSSDSKDQLVAEARRGTLAPPENASTAHHNTGECKV